MGEVDCAGCAICAEGADCADYLPSALRGLSSTVIAPPRRNGSTVLDYHRDSVKFCSNCAAPVSRRVPPGDSLPRYVCDECGNIHYQNPRLVVGAIAELAGSVLLCRRAIEPRYGYWTLPAGYMENDETTAQAALRETHEEAGASIELDAPFSMISVPHVNQVHLFYRARIVDPVFRPGEESLEAALFEESRVPWKDLAFRTVSMSLKLWFEDRRAGAYTFHAADIRRF